MSKSSKIGVIGKVRDPKRESVWRDRLGRQADSGLNVRVFCRREKLAESAFHFWRREIRRRDGQRDADGRLTVPRFVELRVATTAAPPGPVVRRGRLELLLPGDRRLLIRAGCDAALLAMVLDVLDSAGAISRSAMSVSKGPAVSSSNREGRSC